MSLRAKVVDRAGAGRCTPWRARAPDGVRGFTLVELLVVIAVAAVLAVIAVPSFQNSVTSNRADTASNQFVALLSMARSEALKQGATVQVCAGTGTYPCSPTVAGSTPWSGGWSVCCTPGSVAANGAAPVQTGSALAAPMTAYGNFSTIGFNALGQLVMSGVTFPSTPANFIFCPDGVDATKAKGVTVGVSGRVRLADTDPATGAPFEEGDSADMACNNP
jgi:type IV fimbrial biogenesis protein FimT